MNVTQLAPALQHDRLVIFTATNSDGTVDTVTQPLRAGAEPPSEHVQYGRVYVMACVVSGDVDTDSAFLEAVRRAEEAGDLSALLEDAA